MKENAHNADVQGDQMSETDRTDGCRTLLVKSTSISSFCCTSTQCSWYI